MSGDPWNAAVAQPIRDPRRGKALAAAVLLIVTAGLAVGGSFGAFIVHHSDPGPDGSAITQSTSGWRFEITGLDVPADQLGSPPLNGVPLTLAGLLAIAAAILLLVRARDERVPAAGRGLAMLAGSLLAGTVAAVWFDLVLAVRAATSGAALWGAAEIGVGGWVILAAALLAVVAAGLVAATGAQPARPAGSPLPPYPARGPSGAPYGQAPGWGPYPPQPPHPPQAGPGWHPSQPG
jgi:hypothetical protein